MALQTVGHKALAKFSPSKYLPASTSDIVSGHGVVVGVLPINNFLIELVALHSGTGELFLCHGAKPTRF
jgi:hypothetical protein